MRDGGTFVMVWSVEALADEELPDIDARKGVTTVNGFASSVLAEVTDGPVAPCQVVPATAN